MCALQVTFLDRFLLNVVYRVITAPTAAFLDGFLSYFVWRCIFVISTRLLFLVMLPPGVPSFIGSKMIV